MAQKGRETRANLNASKRYLDMVGGGQGRAGQRRAAEPESASKRAMSISDWSAGLGKRVARHPQMNAPSPRLSGPMGYGAQGSRK